MYRLSFDCDAGHSSDAGHKEKGEILGVKEYINLRILEWQMLSGCP